MAYDQELAGRIRVVLADRPGVEEKKMFGGLTFMLNGNMCCGVLNDDLVVRVGPDQYEEALGLPHARPMDFTGRPLNGMLSVGPEGYQNEATLESWVARAVNHALSLKPGGHITETEVEPVREAGHRDVPSPRHRRL
jgi:TfoX/Sxy family transcriptional regulator of competence genes